MIWINKVELIHSHRPWNFTKRSVPLKRDEAERFAILLYFEKENLWVYFIAKIEYA